MNCFNLYTLVWLGCPNFPSGRAPCRRNGDSAEPINNRYAGAARKPIKAERKAFFYYVADPRQAFSLRCRGALALSTATCPTRFYQPVRPGRFWCRPQPDWRTKTVLSRDDDPVDRDTATTLFSLLSPPNANGC
ncbi:MULTISPECIES: hypothetical protein [unclassified Spirosoma]|uniref:hypothetical protein n=1 Tax=unclassified Spirosoma TaxID=2621999 RepID=UPI000962C29A|nr:MULTISPECIES: hypothetical protein [unclassified Spirosoma]MBN8820550.1 hypothetical protein [Spirosoma sp.]OJW71338.1 MAG: hypothetical protein BGO59_05105 [Spirosoma sp. 48-14]